MLKLRNFWKGFLVGFLIMVFSFFICPISFAEDYETPHEFKPGDVISADMMNEVLDYIRNSQKTVSQADLVGNWTCSSYADGAHEGQADSRWTLVNGIYLALENVSITFQDDGDGTYSLSTSAPSPFQEIGCPNAVQADYEVIADTFISLMPHRQVPELLTAVYFHSINMISNNRFKLTTEYCPGGCAYMILCDKQNLPPDKPTNLSATTSGLTVSLSWTDNSSNETGFKIVRKDTLEGIYSQIGTASANATSYSDTVSAAGKYWYRVKATNANGDSVGSNVVKVTVTQ